MIGYEKGVLKLRGVISTNTRYLLQLGGFFLLLGLWILLTVGQEPIVRKGILPKPSDTFQAFVTLLLDNDLIFHAFHSIGLNLAGYIEAAMFAILFGFLIGLFPLFRGLFQKQVDALRFVPLTACTGIFITWFGLGVGMKVHFLAFGIFIYLLPVVVQRVDEVASVYLKTVYTLGANNWQTILTVYIPHVMSKLIDDLRILTAISWTYIIIAESLGNEGGIGSLIWLVGMRQGRMDKVFALLIVIILIGATQDWIFKRLDRHFFPHKYKVDEEPDQTNEKMSEWLMVKNYILKSLVWTTMGIIIILLVNEFTGVLTDTQLIRHYFGGTSHVASLTLMGIVIYQFYYTFVKNKS